MSGTKRTTLLIVAVLLACWMAISVATASPASAASGHAAVSTRQAAALQKNARILVATYQTLDVATDDADGRLAT